jgi:hypothetical protein
MKTKKEVLNLIPEYKNLVNAVLRNLGGTEYIEDVINNGASAGFPGFTYYSDTVKFFKAHKKDILKLAEDLASQIGNDSIISMIQNFNCLTSGNYKERKLDYTQDEIAKAIYTGKGERAEIIQNALAWFALEEVCRMFED